MILWFFPPWSSFTYRFLNNKSDIDLGLSVNQLLLLDLNVWPSLGVYTNIIIMISTLHLSLDSLNSTSYLDLEGIH